MKRLLIVLLLLVLPTLSVSAPVAPDLSYEASGKEITLDWTPVPGALGYRLYYAPYPFAGMNTIGSLDMGSEVSVSYLLWENAAYYIAIKAFDETSESDYSNIELFIMGPPNPEWVDDDTDGFTEIEAEVGDSGSRNLCSDVSWCLNAAINRWRGTI